MKIRIKLDSVHKSTLYNMKSQKEFIVSNYCHHAIRQKQVDFSS
jgi:hypothetical protein